MLRRKTKMMSTKTPVDQVKPIRRPSHALGRLFLLLTPAAMVLSLAIPAPSAEAQPDVSPARAALPIVAGTELVGTKLDGSDGSCTAGPVLVPAGIFQRITPYQNAVRYVVTAKHCFRNGDDIRAGGRHVGTIVWRSADSDLALVKVPPIQDSSSPLRCSTHSHAAFCSPIQSFTPMARGQVFMFQRARTRPVPVQGSSDAPDERFCSSGAFSGILCVWHGISIPADVVPTFRHVVAAEANEGANIEVGDSGGPMLTYGASLVGVISSRLADRNIVLYTPMSQVLQELHGYRLAPA